MAADFDPLWAAAALARAASTMVVNPMLEFSLMLILLKYAGLTLS